MTCTTSEDSDKPGHAPSLIRDFPVRMKKPWVLSYPLSAQRRLWTDWVDAQADLSLRWAHKPFCWFWHEQAQFWYHVVHPVNKFAVKVIISFQQVPTSILMNVPVQGKISPTQCSCKCRQVVECEWSVFLFVLRLNVPVNNFSVMSGQGPCSSFAARPSANFVVSENILCKSYLHFFTK